MLSKEKKPKKEKKTKVTRESIGARSFSGRIALMVTIYAIATSIFHIYLNSFSLMIVIKKNAIHLGMMMALAFLMYPATRKSDRTNPSKLDYLLALASLAIGFYIFFTYDSLIERALIPIPSDYVFAVIAVLLTLEAARRAVGVVLPLLSIAFLIYARFGQMFPGVLAHRGFSWERILTRMYLTGEGLFGVSIMVSMSYVFLFILFGSFLHYSGTARFFNDFALSFAGKLRGGPAQVAVMASGLMGTISGSAQANVATTGTFTIPLMKKVGYSPRFSGAVEAAASTGGILMPPIMGAASFIMASFLGIPYLKIMYAGIIPALFYYFAIFVVVDFRAQKIGLKGLDPSEIPVLKDVMKEQGHLALPIVVILYFLVKGVTPLYAAFFGLISTVVFSGLKKSTRMSLKDILNALDEGARTAVAIAIACGVVGFIVGVVAMTGLGQVIALNIMKLSFGYLWLALILVMIASIFLGMGLPATACYIITASVAAPALIRMGVLPIAAHFFAFYYGTLSAVVPPVALTSYTAAGISGANPTEVAFSGFKLAIAGLIIPFMFVYSPILLMQNVVPGYLIMTVITGLLGIYSLGVANENYFRSPLKIHERLMALGAALLMIKPGYLTDSMGIALMALFILSNLYRNKKAKEKLLSA